MKKTITILDYGVGNLRSVINAFEYLGVKVVATKDKEEVNRSDGIVIPGVGAFGSAMQEMKRHGLDTVVQDMSKKGKPILGICVGFQILMASSVEMGEHRGLNIFPLKVEKLLTLERLPHIGWANLTFKDLGKSKSILLKGIESPRFYFLHTYAPVVEKSPDYLSAYTEYGGCEFTSLIESGHIFGTQFHPEKSGKVGLTLLKNFSEYVENR